MAYNYARHAASLRKCRTHEYTRRQTVKRNTNKQSRRQRCGDGAARNEGEKKKRYLEPKRKRHAEIAQPRLRIFTVSSPQQRPLIRRGGAESRAPAPPEGHIVKLGRTREQKLQNKQKRRMERKKRRMERDAGRFKLKNTRRATL